jgi:DNA-binding NarL/FixJ family response regulator
VRGLSNRSIAAELVLSHRTVESHISRLLAKTGCKSRTQLLLWALAER